MDNVLFSQLSSYPVYQLMSINQFTDSPFELVVNIGGKLSINGLFFIVYCILCYFSKSIVGVEFIQLVLSLLVFFGRMQYAPIVIMILLEYNELCPSYFIIFF